MAGNTPARRPRHPARDPAGRGPSPLRTGTRSLPPSPSWTPWCRCCWYQCLRDNGLPALPAEALAAATPALAFPNGAAPEIIDHGRTGYLCRGEDEMTAAVARVHQISRRQCRAAAEQRFSLARMAAGYDRLYRAILERPGRLGPERTGTGAP